MPDYGVRLEYIGNVGLVTLDRPERWNAFNDVMWAELESAAARLNEKCPRVVVITGAGNRAFCAGQDVNPDNPQIIEQAKALETKDKAVAKALIMLIRKAVDSLCGLPVPIIAALNGAAYGGGAELAARCDLRVMDPKAVITFSEVKLGLMPDWGGGVALTRILGPSKAADLILTARRVEAKEALEIGLTNRISAPDKALEQAMEMAQAIAQNGPHAIRCALELIRRTPDMPQSKALDLESKNAINLILTGECIHGITAFLEKTIPDFPDIK